MSQTEETTVEIQSPNTEDIVEESKPKRRGRPPKAKVIASEDSSAVAAVKEAPKKRTTRRKKSTDETGEANAEGVSVAESPRKRTIRKKESADEKVTSSSSEKSGESSDNPSNDLSHDTSNDEPKTPARKRTTRKPKSDEGTAQVETSNDAGDSADDASHADSEETKSNKRSSRSRKSDTSDEESNDTNDDANRNSRNTRGGRNSRNNRSGRGSSSRGGRSSRGSSGRNSRARERERYTGPSYKDLQEKILSELHLLAKEIELDDYRQMNKEELSIAILEKTTENDGLKLVNGYLEISSDGYGFLQDSLLQNNTRKVIVSAGLIKQFKLRTGDHIMGKARRPRDNERYGTLLRVEAVNGVEPFQASKRPRFDDLTPTFPDNQITLETGKQPIAARVIDLLAPIGRGQRGLIVAPPKAGKTTLLKTIANSVVKNAQDIKVIVLLIDERPEEVTDFRESVEGVEVVASTFDEPPANHVRVAEFVHERARRIVEEGGDVMILLDSITRLARANNLVTPPTGRTLSGGLDSSALHWPKRFLGAARNIRGGGSLSILATALVETGSRMDDVIFEEFKGTGNMELHLSRRLEERRIFPAIDILKSSTRRDDLLLDEDTLAKMWLLRKVIADMDPAEAMEMLLARLSRTNDNNDFLSTLSGGA